jgi:septum formation protein
VSLILASRSPQRRAILDQLQIPFEVRPADIDELSIGEPDAVTRANALAKAEAVAGNEPHAPVLGVDTVVTLDGSLHGKAGDAGEAHQLLERLSGRTHEVWSGIALLAKDATRVGTCRTLVRFRRLDAGLLDWYVATREWEERAGAYAIQGRGAALVERIEGDYWNVVGLPVTLFVEFARDLLPGLFSARDASDMSSR